MEGGTDNTYAYVNDPIGSSDYSGLLSWQDVKDGAKALGQAIVDGATKGITTLATIANATANYSNQHLFVPVVTGVAVIAAVLIVRNPAIVSSVATTANRAASGFVSRIAAPVSKGVSGGYNGAGDKSQVVQNAVSGRIAENTARISLASTYGSANVRSQVGFATPIGRRVIDFVVKRPGQPDMLVEVKSGMARYGGAQLEKDFYLVSEYDYEFMLLTLP